MPGVRVCRSQTSAWGKTMIRLPRNTGVWFSAFWMLHGNAQAQVHPGGVEIKLTTAVQRYCHIVRFPRGWEFKGFDHPENGPMYFDDAGDFEFRADHTRGNGFLVGGFVIVAESRSDTTNQYKIDLSKPDAPALPASRESWDAAEVVPLTRRSTFSAYTELEQDETKFNGFHLAKSGAHWFGPLELVSRLSPDSLWLVLQSWTGTRGSPRMTIFEDVFESTSGKKILTIEGTCSSRDYPRAYLGMAAWLTERYFVVPLGAHRERCLVCEFSELHHR